MARRYFIITVILIIIASVFYVATQFFTQGNVASSSGGSIDVNSQLFYLKLGALAGFLVVAIVGLYICFKLLSDPDPNNKRSRDKERYTSWKVDFKELQFPSFRSEDEEEEK